MNILNLGWLWKPFTLGKGNKKPEAPIKIQTLECKGIALATTPQRSLLPTEFEKWLLTTAVIVYPCVQNVEKNVETVF